MESAIVHDNEFEKVLAELLYHKEEVIFEANSPCLVKQFYCHNGNIVSWSSSNRNKQIGNIGFNLLQQNLVSPKNLLYAFLKQVSEKKHYCDILMERGGLSKKDLESVTSKVITEELAESFTWSNGKYKVLPKTTVFSSIYGSPYLKILTFSIPVETIAPKINNYLHEWHNLKQQLQNFQIILCINKNLEKELYEYLCCHYIFYKYNLPENTSKIFTHTICDCIPRNLAFFNGELTLEEIIPLLGIDSLFFCNMALDLYKNNYLVKISIEQTIDLAQRSKKANNFIEAKKYYQTLLVSPDVPKEDKQQIKNTIKNIEEHTSKRLKKYNMEVVEHNFPGYEIIEELGRGGMGTVYKAQQKSLSREVAIKVVRPNLSIDDIFIKRLEIEAKTMAKLRHPNIVSAIDFGFQREICYIVMEYIPGGKTFSDVIENKKCVPEQEVFEIGLAIAKALKYLEQNHLVHRDIKPSNILLDQDGTAKLADLGLIKDTQTENDLTMTGAAVGTPAYMSPEQLQIDCELDIRSDIFSLGATLLHAITGKLRFHNSTPAGVIYHKIISQTETYLKEQKISASAKKIFGKMVSPQRENRYDNIDELIEDLERAISGKTVKFTKKATPLYIRFAFVFMVLLVTSIVLFNENIRKYLVVTTKEQNHEITSNPKDPIEQRSELVFIDTDHDNEDFIEREIEDDAIVNNYDRINPVEELETLYNKGEYQEFLSRYQKWQETDNTVQLNNLQGQAFFKLKKYSEAEACFEQLLLSNPKSFEGLLGKASCLYKKNQFHEALETLQQIDSDTFSLDYYYLKALIFYSQENIKEAQQCIDLVLQENNSFWQAYYLQSLLWHEKKPQLAEQHLNTLLTNSIQNISKPVLMWLYYYRGALLFKQKNLLARESFQLSYDTLANKESLEYLALLAIKSQKYNQAMDYFTQAFSTNSLGEYTFPEDIEIESLKKYHIEVKEIYFNRAKSFQALKKYELALKDFENSLKIDAKYQPALKESFLIYKEKQEWPSALKVMDILQEIAPQNLSFHWEKAKLLYKLEMHEKAIDSFSFLINSNYKKAESIRLRSKCYLALKDPKVIKDFNRILQIDKNNVEVLLQRAQFYKDQKNNEKAKEDYLKIIAIDNKNQKAYEELIQYYSSKKDFVRLAQTYDNLIGVFPNNIDYLYNASRSHIILKNYLQAKSYLEIIEKKQPDYSDVTFYLGLCYYSTSDYENAFHKFSRAIEHKTKNIQAYYFRGFIYYQKNMHREAIIDLSFYIKYAPQDTNAIYLRANSYKNINLYSRALKDYQSLIIQNPQNYKWWEEKGQCEFSLNLYKLALKSFLNADKSQNLSATSYNYLGYCYSQFGKTQKAIDYYKKSIETDPSYALAKINYAITLYLQEKYQEALSEISKAIVLEPNNTSALQNRGKINLKLTYYREAEKDFATLLQIKPENGEAFYYLALSQYKLEKYSDAKVHFAKALQYNIGERADIAKKYLKIIQKIEKSKD